VDAEQDRESLSSSGAAVSLAPFKFPLGSQFEVCLAFAAIDQTAHQLVVKLKEEIFVNYLFPF
jgi:hypothetical protein